MSNNDEITREAVDKMKICLQCEHFFKPTKQCKKCGCFMPVKVRIPGMRCPVRKWQLTESQNPCRLPLSGLEMRI